MSWESVAVLASGPSLSQEIVDGIHDMRIIAINRQFELAPHADIFYGSDSKFWRQYVDQIRPLGGEMICLEPNVPAGVQSMKRSEVAFDTRDGYLSTGRNSGYAAVCLAVKRGAKRVYLHGFDMRMVGRQARRFEYPKHMNSVPPFQNWIEKFRVLSIELKRRGVTVINCTPGSALNCFPRQEDSRAA